MPNDIFIQIRGQERIRRRLDMLGNPMLMQELHDRIGTEILKWVKSNVDAGGLERAWPPLRPNTLFARRKGSASGGGQPMKDSNQMMLSLNMQATAAEAKVGFGSKIAVFHQWGTRGPYTIAPRFKRALAFPSLWTREFAQQSLGPRGYARLFRGPRGAARRPAFADKLPRAAVSQWLTVRQGTRRGAMSRMPASQQKARGLKDYASKTFMVVRSVQHPGLPARPLLPSTGLAREIATRVAQRFVQDRLGRQ